MSTTGKSTATAETQAPAPTLGRVVLVPENPDHNNGAKVACAVVVGVQGDTINVRVWADNSDTPEWRTSLHQVDSVEEFDAPETITGDRLHRWCWPPRA